jgi:hypothetical protein
MSNQQSRQDDEPEPQQDNQLVNMTPEELLLLQMSVRVVQLVCTIAMEEYTSRSLRTPYHTSALSGAGWVCELLNGHPQRIRNELGVSRSTFIVLLKSMQALDLKSSRHVSLEEQLAIFLYTVVTGLSCIHVGERFQRSPSTITKYVLYYELRHP